MAPGDHNGGLGGCFYREQGIVAGVCAGHSLLSPQTHGTVSSLESIYRAARPQGSPHFSSLRASSPLGAAQDKASKRRGNQEELLTPWKQSHVNTLPRIQTGSMGTAGSQGESQETRILTP